MSNVKQTRLENFETLIQEAGGVAELARRCGYAKPAYLYQVRSQKPKPNGSVLQIGRRVAATLEKGMGKPAGWMDKKHRKPSPAATPTQPAASPANPVGLKIQAAGSDIRSVTLAVTGASGFPYALRLLECLLAAGKTVYLLCSSAAREVALLESGIALPENPQELQSILSERFQAASGRLFVFGEQEWRAPIASGTAAADAMIICPASMGTVAALAHGISDNLIERAADVCIKEKRPMIVVPRETPLSAIHLENMLKLAQNGCTILPAAPAFYHKPQNLADMVDFLCARILDQLRIPHTLINKWGS